MKLSNIREMTKKLSSRDEHGRSISGHQAGHYDPNQYALGEEEVNKSQVSPGNWNYTGGSIILLVILK